MLYYGHGKVITVVLSTFLSDGIVSLLFCMSVTTCLNLIIFFGEGTYQQFTYAIFLCNFQNLTFSVVNDHKQL